MQQQSTISRGTFQEGSLRSIFVGNISYDVNENEVRQILSQVGQVIKFRIVHDRETGRPKGFGFCEFADVSSVETAIRNLNGYELHGRPLRIDSATGGDRSADEVQQFQLSLSAGQSQQSQSNGTPGPTTEPEFNPYGPTPEPGKAPEAIANRVASITPERMFEIMKQMKDMVNNNPQMARHMLVENPQLAYALLQAQIVMRVVDPKVAYSMLHRESPASPPFHQQTDASGPATSVAPPQQQVMLSLSQQPSVMNAPLFSQPPPGIGGIGIPPISTAGAGQIPPHMMHQQQQQFSGQQAIYRPPIQPLSHGMPSMSVPPPGMLMTHPPPMVSQSQQQQQVSPSASSVGNQQDEEDEEAQAQMLVKVLQLTDEQIRMLPPEDRVKVIELRNQLRQQVSSSG